MAIPRAQVGSRSYPRLGRRRPVNAMNGRSPINVNTWYALREFETRDITARSYKDRHSLDLSAAKAREISSNFVQAREYFRNASAADFTVRPLLLYYGVASFSRGLTLFLDPKKRETSLKQSHGLQIYDWVQVLSNGLNEIGNLRIRLTKGLFHDLLSSTSNRFYFRHKSSAVNWSVGAQIPPTGSEFMLQEIAARIPDVSNQYDAWTGESFPSVVLDSLQVNGANGPYRFSVIKSGAKELDRVFPAAHFPGRSVMEDENNLVVETASADGIFFAQRAGWLNIGDVVLYGPLESKLYVSPLAACFMLSFALGMLCRYFPTTWINMARTEKGGCFLSTRDEAIGLDRRDLSCHGCGHT